MIREHGETWVANAWQARLWSSLLIEIPKQVYEHAHEQGAPYRARIEELRRYFADESESEVLVQAAFEQIARLPKLAIAISTPASSSVPACAVASISRSVGEWPERYETRVEFALCRQGEVSIRCLGVPEGRTKLPTFVRGPRENADAAAAAASLIRAAIQLVAD